MSPKVHYVYVGTFVAIVLAAVAFLSFEGYGYYSEQIDQRYFHPDHLQWKPSGIIGHGLGIAGSLFMLIGVLGYMIRKRAQVFRRWGLLKYWLEAHIFLCTLGPFLVLFHTSFKFGGIVAISFWSMVAVVLSGVIGRFIYIQIPKTIEGRQLSKNEIAGLQSDIQQKLMRNYSLDDSILGLLKQKTDNQSENIALSDKKILKEIKRALSAQKVKKAEKKQIIGLIKQEFTLNRRIKRLVLMQKLFGYWHVAHLPFAILMLIIMLVHIVVAITFGAHWIF